VGARGGRIRPAETPTWFGTASADPPAAKVGPMVPRRPIKRVWSEEHGRFTDWSELSKTVPSPGDDPTT
jgi:hypothetical protein